MNTLSHLPWYRSTTLPASAHVAMQCAQILAKLDSEGLGLRDTDEYSYTPPVRGQCPSLDGADLTPDELTGEDIAATMRELFPAPAQGYQALLDADDDWSDDMLASPVGGSTSEDAWQARLAGEKVAARAACVVPTWAVDPEQSDSLPRWAELRALEFDGRLKKTERKELHKLSIALGGVGYWQSLPPASRDARGNRRVECVHGKWTEVDGKPAGIRLARVPSEVERQIRNQGVTNMWGKTSEATARSDGGEVRSDATPQGEHTGRRAGSERGRRVVGRVAAETLTAVCLPPHVSDSEEDDVEVPASLECSLPAHLAARQAELGDHALFVLYLLYRTRGARDILAESSKPASEQGWRPLSMALLQRQLGQQRIAGKQVWRTAHLMGSRTAPGLLERLGIIERRSGYAEGYAQRYRLTCQDRTLPTAPVNLAIRKIGKLVSGPAVPEGLRSDYLQLALAYHDALYDLCRRAGIPESCDATAIGQAIKDLPKPAVVLTKAGEPAKKQPKDPRVTWQGDLERICEWPDPMAASRRHCLYRSFTTTRLESPFASLPSWARRYMRLAGSPMISLDVRAAALTFGAAHLRATGADKDPDVAGWCDMIEDPTRDPYTSLYCLVHGREPSDTERAKFKRASVFGEIIYGSVGALRKSAIGQAIERTYPGYFQLLIEEKMVLGDDYASAGFRREAAVMIDALSPVFAAAGVPVVTLHDAIFVREQDAAKAATLFREVLVAAGVRAVIR